MNKNYNKFERAHDIMVELRDDGGLSRFARL